MVLFTFFSNLIKHSVSKGDPDQSVASDLGLNCLPMSHKLDARLLWVNK